MVLSARTHTTLFASHATPVATDALTTKTLIRLPLSIVPLYEKPPGAPGVAKQLFRPNLWSSDEHERFLHGLEMFPKGPWKEVAKIVGTKTTRQTMTHAQKYRQKIERRMVSKPKEPSKKKRRSCVQDSSDFSVSGCVTSGADVPFSLMLSKLESELMVASPKDVACDAFDMNFLNQELDTFLKSIDLPLSADEILTSTSSWIDEVGVCTV